MLEGEREGEREYNPGEITSPGYRPNGDDARGREREREPDLWYLRISRKAKVPGRKRFTPLPSDLRL